MHTQKRQYYSKSASTSMGASGNVHTSHLSTTNLPTHPLCPGCKQPSPLSTVISHPLQCKDPSNAVFLVGYTTVRCSRCEIDHSECINNPQHGRLAWQRITRGNNKKCWLLKCLKCAKKRSRSGGDRGEWTRCEHPRCLGLYHMSDIDRSVAKHDQTIRERNVETSKMNGIFKHDSNTTSTPSLQRSSMPMNASIVAPPTPGLSTWNHASMPTRQYVHGPQQQQRMRRYNSPSTAADTNSTSFGHALTLLASASAKAPAVARGPVSLTNSGPNQDDDGIGSLYFAIRLACPRCKHHSPSSAVVSHPLQCRDPGKQYFKIGYTTVRCTRCDIDHTECINNPQHGRLVWQRVTRRNHKTRWFLRCPKCAEKRSRTGKGERGEWTRCEHPKCLGLYRSNRGTNNDRSIDKHNETINAIHKRKSNHQFIKKKSVLSDKSVELHSQTISRLLAAGAFAPNRLAEDVRLGILKQMGVSVKTNKNKLSS